MQEIKAIFVNKKDVLDEASDQHYIYDEIMGDNEKRALENFETNSYLVVPHTDESGKDVITNFYIILRDENVNLEAFFNGIFGLYNIIKEFEPGMLDYIKEHGLDIVLNRISVCENYITSAMVEMLFSSIFKI